jgi:hypothetical protein
MYCFSTQQRAREDSQHVIFMLDPESNQFTYADVLHRIQLRKTKLASEEKRRRGAIVHRRAYSEFEQERRQAILYDVGGIYDEGLDDEDHVRHYKRQRNDNGASEGKSEDDEPPAAASNGASSPAVSSDSDSD